MCCSWSKCLHQRDEQTLVIENVLTRLLVICVVRQTSSTRCSVGAKDEIITDSSTFQWLRPLRVLTDNLLIIKLSYHRWAWSNALLRISTLDAVQSWTNKLTKIIHVQQQTDAYNERRLTACEFIRLVVTVENAVTTLAWWNTLSIATLKLSCSTVYITTFYC